MWWTVKICKTSEMCIFVLLITLDRELGYIFVTLTVSLKDKRATQLLINVISHNKPTIMNTLAAFVTALYQTIHDIYINGILWICIYCSFPSVVLSPIQRHNRMQKKERWFILRTHQVLVIAVQLIVLDCFCILFTMNTPYSQPDSPCNPQHGSR